MGLDYSISPGQCCGLGSSLSDPSVFYLVIRRLLGSVVVPARREASKDAELLVLRHQNAVLRRQISRVRYQPAERLWLTALSRLIPRRRWAEVFAVTLATLLAWHRRLVTRKWDFTSRRRPGRPFTAAAIRTLVIRMAIDKPAWGHQRIIFGVGDDEASSGSGTVVHPDALLKARQCLGFGDDVVVQDRMAMLEV